MLFRFINQNLLMMSEHIIFGSYIYFPGAAASEWFSGGKPRPSLSTGKNTNKHRTYEREPPTGGVYIVPSGSMLNRWGVSIA